jgi:hypothetical protein
MPERFSDRHGFRGPPVEITIRNEAPESLRFAVAELAAAAGLSPARMRDIVCRILLAAPDAGNWSDPNISREVQFLLADCPWYKVYDVAEAFSTAIRFDKAEQFKSELNQFFQDAGIGWQLTHEGIVFRGDEVFDTTMAEAGRVLIGAGRRAAANEIHEALKDISRRPSPDITGAVQHAVAALECTARESVGDANGTLGALLPRLQLPKPLDAAVEKLWGFASDRARHIREGQTVNDVDAQLLVSVSCAVCIFLTKRA